MNRAFAKTSRLRGDSKEEGIDDVNNSENENDDHEDEEVNEDLENDGVYFKDMLPICVMGCHSNRASLTSCPKCNCAYFCSKQCEKTAWRIHKVSCEQFSKWSKIACVSLSVSMGCQLVYLSPNDSIFHTAARLPLADALDIPLLAQCVDPGENCNLSKVLLCSPETGDVPLSLASMGTLVLCRSDRMPLTPLHVYQLVFYLEELIACTEKAENVFNPTKNGLLNFISSLRQNGNFEMLGVNW